jgi:hypothetical protein
MAKEKEQMTMEEYLLSQLETPVKLKDGTAATSRAVAVRTRARGWSRNRQTSQSTSRDIRKGASLFLLNTN